MNKQAVISVTALLALGAGIGVFWRQLEREPAAEVAQSQGGTATGMDAGTAPAPASAELLAEKLRASLDAGGARPAGPQGTDSPEVLQKRAAARSKLEAEYPDLDAALELTPEQAGQFLDLLARQEVDIAELIAARPGDNRDGIYSRQLSRDIEVMERSDDAEQAALLGGKFPDWVQFQQDDMNRNPVDKLHGMLVRQGGTGIAATDADALVAALTAEQTRFSKDWPRTTEAQWTSPRQLLEQELKFAANNRELVKVASRYLTTQQLEAYEQLLQQRARTAQRLLRTMGGESGE